MVIADTYPKFKMFYSCEKLILRKKTCLPIEKFPSLVLPRNAIKIQQLISMICQVVAYRRLKKKRKFHTSALKVIAVAYENWSVTRGSKCSDLTWKRLVFC